MEKLDCLVVLGARIGIDEGGHMTSSRHLRMRIKSAIIWHHANPSAKIIIPGGRAFGIRYPLALKETTFKQPDFSEQAKAYAKTLPAESAYISLMMNAQGEVPFQSMVLEQESLTTSQNAEYTAPIAKQLGVKKIGVLSMVYHLNRPRENTMEVFSREFSAAGLERPIPIYTEEILYQESEELDLMKIREFYENPQSGFLWSAEEICQRLIDDKSLWGLKPIKVVE